MKEFCIYIDGLFYKGAGIGRYYESLTKELSNRNIKIITSIPKKLRNEFEKDFAEYPNIEPIFVDYEKFSLKGFYQHSKILKELKNKVDLFFYPHINLPYYIPERTVITIHDLRPFTPYWDRNKIKLNIFGYFLKRAVLYSQRIICISKTVETSLLSFYSAAENKTCVIYRFIDEKFMSNEFTKPIIPGSYVLFVGSRKKHKNLGMLIKSFNNIKRIVPHNLVIAGSKESDFDEIDDLKEILHLKDRIIEVLSPDDNTIINLYHYADLFVFPSLYEGFGLPPLEAISLRCPVILADIPVLKEIFNDTVLYFNPLSENDMANKMLSVLQNSNIRENLIKMEENRLTFFNKNVIINQHIELFKKVARGQNNEDSLA